MCVCGHVHVLGGCVCVCVCVVPSAVLRLSSSGQQAEDEPSNQKRPHPLWTRWVVARSQGYVAQTRELSSHVPKRSE